MVSKPTPAEASGRSRSAGRERVRVARLPFRRAAKKGRLHMDDAPRSAPGALRGWLSKMFSRRGVAPPDGQRIAAVWQGEVIAEAAKTDRIEGNHYFPPEAVHQHHLRPSATRTVCPWKGVAHYYSIAVGDKLNVDAAWLYPEPTVAARHIKGKIAFWKGVRIERRP